MVSLVQVDVLVVSVGGGGLVAGLAAYAKTGRWKEGRRSRNAGGIGGQEARKTRRAGGQGVQAL